MIIHKQLPFQNLGKFQLKSRKCKYIIVDL